MDRQTDRPVERERQTDRQTDRQRQRDTHTHTQRQRQTDTDTADKKRERQTDTPGFKSSSPVSCARLSWIQTSFRLMNIQFPALKLILTLIDARVTFPSESRGICVVIKFHGPSECRCIAFSCL